MYVSIQDWSIIDMEDDIPVAEEMPDDMITPLGTGIACAASRPRHPCLQAAPAA